MPSPTCFVVKNGSKILLSLPSGMPWPEFGDLDHHVVAAQDHRPVAVQVAGEMDVAGGDPDLAAARHRVPGVDDEVHDHLLDLALVDPDRGEVGPVLDLQRHLVGQKPVQEVGELGERVLQVDDGRAQGLLAREGEELADQRRRPVGVLADLHQVAVLDVGDLVAHQEQVAVAVDRGQQVVEVVGDPAGELAHRLHLLALHELRLERLELGGVGEHGEERRRAVEHGAGERHLQEDLLAVGGAARDLRAAERAAAGGVGQSLGDRPAEPFDQVGDVDAGLRPLAEERARGLVGVGEPPRGLEPGQRHWQLVEEMIGDEPRDLGAVERHQQEVAPALRSRHHDRAHRLARAREHVDAVGPERPVGQQAVELGPAAAERRRRGVRLQHPVVAVDAQPGNAGLVEARDRRAHRRAALEAPEQRPRPGPGDDHALVVAGRLDGDPVQPRLPAHPVAHRLGGGPVEQPAAAAGRVAAEQAAVEVGQEHRLGVALEVPERTAAPTGGARGRREPQREEVGPEDQERDGERPRHHGRPAPEAGQDRAEEQGAGGGEPRPGAKVAARGSGLRLNLFVHHVPPARHLLYPRSSTSTTGFVKRD